MIYLFDLDGTLVDTAPDLVRSALHVCRLKNVEPPEFDKLVFCAGKGVKAMLAECGFNVEDDELFKELRSAFLDYFSVHMTDYSKPFDGVEELLGSLKERGARMGVATNKPVQLALQTLSELGLSDYFEVVLGFDSPGCARKPAPDTLLAAAAAMNVAIGEIVFIGDDKNDVDAADAAGCACAFAAWGYGIAPENVSALLRPQDVLKM